MGLAEDTFAYVFSTCYKSISRINYRPKARNSCKYLFSRLFTKNVKSKYTKQ